ncbi:AAA family ATPase [uncultured Rikenella sp.]
MIDRKGGAAKTTTAINLASYYAKNGFRILAVDLDPQSNMTEALG